MLKTIVASGKATKHDPGGQSPTIIRTDPDEEKLLGSVERG
jgi:hypothetical protein